MFTWSHTTYITYCQLIGLWCYAVQSATTTTGSLIWLYGLTPQHCFLHQYTNQPETIYLSVQGNLPINHKSSCGRMLDHRDLCLLSLERLDNSQSYHNFSMYHIEEVGVARLPRPFYWGCELKGFTYCVERWWGPLQRSSQKAFLHSHWCHIAYNHPIVQSIKAYKKNQLYRHLFSIILIDAYRHHTLCWFAKR